MKIYQYVFGGGRLQMAYLEKPLGNLCSRICELCLQRGLLLVHTGRESLKIGPPLVISKEALLEGIKVIEEAIDIALKDFQG